MANVGSLKTTISMDSAQFEQSMAGVNRQLKSLQQESKAATSSGTGFARGVDELRSKSDVLNRTLTLQQGKVGELRRRYEESRKATGDNSKATQNASTAYNKAVAEMNKTKNQLKGITDELNRQTDPWRKLGTNLTEAGTKMQDVGKQMTSVGRNLSMKVTAPLVGAGALMLKTGMDFEKSMSNVQAVSGAAGDDLQILEDAAREMGATTTKSASEAADGLGYMALAGWETQEMLDGLEPILRLSEAANIDLGRASDLVTDSMSAMGVEVQDLPKYLDAIAEASRNSNTTMDGLMQAFIGVGGNLDQFNVPLEESTALLGVMADNGIKGTEAGRGLNAILINLTSGAGRAGTAMEELNISAFDSNGEFIGLEETLRLVADRTKDMTDEQQAQYVSMIAGKQHMKTFQALMSDLDDGYVDLKSDIEGAEGALNDMAKTMQDNAAGNVAQLKSAFDELSIQFSEHILPAFTGLVDKATDAVNWFSELEDGTQENIIKMGALAAAIGPTLIVLGSLLSSVGSIVKVMGAAATAIAGKGGLVASLGMLTNPVGIAVGSVAALAGGIYLWNQRSERAAEVNLDVANSMIDTANSLEENVKKYDDLTTVSRLTNDEFSRMLDIQTELERTQDPDKIEKLQEEYEKLAEKSGLNNEQLDKMFELNTWIIEQSPEVEQTFTDKGNAVIKNTDAVHEYIQSLRDMAMEELQLEKLKQLEQEAELRRENNELTEKFAELEDQLNRFRKIGNMEYEEMGDRLSEIDMKLADSNTSTETAIQLNKEKKELIQAQNGGLADQIQKLQDERKEVQKQITDNEIKLQKIIEIDGAIAGLLLLELGINEAGEEGLKIADKKLIEHRKERDLIIDKIDKEGDVHNILRDEVTTLNNKIAMHERVIGKIEDETELSSTALGIEKSRVDEYEEMTDRIKEGTEESKKMTEEAEKSVTKNVDVTDNGTLAQLEWRATKPLSRIVTIRQQITGNIPSYARGTNHHPGGLALHGEEGPELARFGNRYEMLGLGISDLPRGTQIFRNDETKNILNALNNIPGYATGARPSGEANRVVDQLNNQDQQLTVNYERMFEGAVFRVRSEEDIKMVGRELGNTIESRRRARGIG